MKKHYTIGVDIGGTHTDAVLVDGQEKILSAVKVTTTENPAIGFQKALQKLLSQANIIPSHIQGVFVVTTHATNAILQNKGLYSVGVIRIAGHQPDMLPPGFSWPKHLQKTIIAGVETINGGLECHGGLQTPLCSKEITTAADRLLQKGAKSIAIIGVFSPLNGEQEEFVARKIKEFTGNAFPISLSHEISGIGFIERENSTILNSALKQVMRQAFQDLQSIVLEMGILSAVMIAQNDGSLLDLSKAMEYPILTISAGPTNSFIGGSKLAGYSSSIVVDIGGTSTDVGFVLQGFPLRRINTSNIGGIPLNFPMPDVLSTALGGGSVIGFHKEKAIIGPQSVAKTLRKRALAFGGDLLTLTDVALCLHHLTIPNTDLSLVSISQIAAKSIFNQVEEKIQKLVLQMQGENKHLPVILIGGGASLLSTFSNLHYQIPPYFDVANAYGAALAEISGTIDRVVHLDNQEKVLEEMYEKAKQKAILQGADSTTLRLVDQQIIPYSYLPNKMARVIVRFCGKRMITPYSRCLEF